MVLFSAMFSCFLHDSFELHEMVCLPKHGALISGGALSAWVMVNVLAIQLFFPNAGNCGINL